MPARVRDVMFEVEGLLWVQDSQPMEDAVSAMERGGARIMPVRSADGSPLGLLAKRDAVKRLKADRDARVRDACRPWLAVDADATLDEALATLKAEQIGRLPVVNDGDVVGGITRFHIREYQQLERELGADVLQRMAAAPEPPAELAELIGGEIKIGRSHVIQLRRLASLRRDERVLDIGCGVGRTALQLAPYLSEGTYEGFDVHRASIDWCQREITRRHPNFRFTHLDIRNDAYNPNGAIEAEELAFPYPDQYFDLAFLFSVFTHLLPADLECYLAEIRRVLKPEGRVLGTYFLLNAENRRLLGDSEDPAARSLLAGEGPWSTWHDVAEWMVAYDEDYVRALHKAYGLPVQTVSYGDWIVPGLKPGEGPQDGVLAGSVGGQAVASNPRPESEYETEAGD